MNDKIETLDLRNMPPVDRHRKIFEIWNRLNLEFQNLWMEKVRGMLIEEKEMNQWIKIGEKNE
ncbi:MAG: hypothetical protein H8E17_01790 [Deltaproteobacteria bacterium]|nr:hypothetical protein [Deltaproteobacteria bacterium]